MTPTHHPSALLSPVSVALVGAGFIGRGIAHRLLRHPDITLACVVNRNADRAVQALVAAGLEERDIVLSPDETQAVRAVEAGSVSVMTSAHLLAELPNIDVVIEATGALTFGANVIIDALAAGRHVVSMNAEADALFGHHFNEVAARSNVTYSIADGDQPGVLLRLLDHARDLGLEPVVALNCKRNLDVRQNQAASRVFAERDGTSVAMTTAFGDGTKMHIENVVVANLSGLSPPPFGTPGVRTTLASVARDVESAALPSSSVHYTLGGDFGGGVLVLARSNDPEFDAPYLRYSKLGDGPLYPLFRPYHLIHMEVARTVQRVAAGKPGLGTRHNQPVARCAAVAKRDLRPGQGLDGIGGDACYGVAVAENEGSDLLPIGLSTAATVVRPVRADHPVTLDDVELMDEDPLVRLARLRRTRGSDRA